jgi:hypothetical protein
MLNLKFTSYFACFLSVLRRLLAFRLFDVFYQVVQGLGAASNNKACYDGFPGLPPYHVPFRSSFLDIRSPVP